MEKEKLEEYQWIKKDGSSIPMIEMDEAYLTKVFNRMCLQEIDAFNELKRCEAKIEKLEAIEAQAFNRVNTFNSLRQKIEKVAESRGIKLTYPDEKFPTKKNWGNYFKAERQNKKADQVTSQAELAQSASNKEEISVSLEQEDTHLNEV